MNNHSASPFFSSIQIRIAAPEDVQELNRLVNSAYRGDSSKQGWTTEADLLGGQRTDEGSLLETIQTPDQAILVFEDRGGAILSLCNKNHPRFIACVFLQKKLDLELEGVQSALVSSLGEVNSSPQSKYDGYVGMLTVSPEIQGRGLGKWILANAESWMRDHWKVEKAWMTVIRQRSELIEWYGRRGYQNTGILKPFPYGDARFGLPKVDDLEFLVLEKKF